MSITSASPAHVDTALIERLDAQVRAAVRRDGVDPQRDVHLNLLRPVEVRLAPPLGQAKAA